MKKDKPVLVVGPVRNCEATVKADVYRIKDALADFDIQWFLIESDSHDASLGRLEELKQEIPGFDYLSLGKLQNNHYWRTDRLAIVRNRYIEEAKTRDVHYVIASDFDGINDMLSINSIRSCEERDDWDVVCANQDGPYYDIWALRAKGWLEHDVWVKMNQLTRNGWSYYPAAEKEVYPYMRRIPLDSEWIEVESAYSGFTIYKKEALICGTHIPFYPDGTERCEIVPLNEAIRAAGYKIFINPRLISGGVNEHTKDVK